jgi:fido (protein-threonine AMPylation protein)
MQVLRHLHFLIIDGIYDCAGNIREEATDRVKIHASFKPAEPHEILVRLPDLLARAADWRKGVKGLDVTTPGTPSPPGDLNPDLYRMVYYAAWVFYDLVVIHPFRGGNGRVSRGFLHLMLYDMKVLTPPAHVFSYMAQRRGAYFRALHQADAGNLHGLAWYLLRGILDTYIQALFDVILGGANAPELRKRLGRDNRRFLEQVHRNRFDDPSYSSRLLSLARSLEKVTERLPPSAQDTADRMVSGE